MYGAAKESNLGTPLGTHARRGAAVAESLLMEAFREAGMRRARRQTVTLARAIRAGRARVRANPPQAPNVDGSMLRDLLADVAVDVELVDIRVNRPPWTATSIEVESGDQVTWLAWGAAHLIKPLGISVPPSLVLGGRVAHGGPVHRSPRDTHTFTADRAGTVELASLSPAGGELPARTGRSRPIACLTARSAAVCRQSSCGGRRAAIHAQRSRRSPPAMQAVSVPRRPHVSPTHLCRAWLGAPSSARTAGDLRPLAGRHRRRLP